MNLDDRLSEAIGAAAPSETDPIVVRTGLGPAMMRARRRQRAGVTAASMIGVMLMFSGTAVAIGQLASDTTELTPRDTSPPSQAPTSDGDFTPEVETTDVPGPATSLAPDSTSPPVTEAPDRSERPAPPSPVDSHLTETEPPGEDDTESPTPTESPDPAVESDKAISGPHSTPCGTATFAHDTTTVGVDSHTTSPGYRFGTEGDGTDQVHVRWDEGPGDECQIEAHLEYGRLEVEIS